jgi:hypothetical protein
MQATGTGTRTALVRRIRIRSLLVDTAAKVSDNFLLFLLVTGHYLQYFAEISISF